MWAEGPLSILDSGIMKGEGVLEALYLGGGSMHRPDELPLAVLVQAGLKTCLVRLELM
jgi:hypothetical protein